MSLRRESLFHTTRNVSFKSDRPAVEVAYADAVVVEGPSVRHIYCSGKTGVLATNGEGNDLPAGVAEQLRQALENLRAVLRSAGADMTDIVRVRVYVVPPITHEVLADIHRVRLQYFPQASLPASTLLGVTSLAREGALVEVDADAVVAVPAERAS